MQFVPSGFAGRHGFAVNMPHISSGYAGCYLAGRWVNFERLRKESSVSQISSLLRVCHCLSRCRVFPPVYRAEILNILYLLAQFFPSASTSTPEWRVLVQEGSVPLQSMGHCVGCGFPATDRDQSSFDELPK